MMGYTLYFNNNNNDQMCGHTRATVAPLAPAVTAVFVDLPYSYVVLP